MRPIPTPRPLASPTVIPVVDEGLGNSAYLVDLGDGRALAVDPCRDLRALRQAAATRRLRIAHAADTHLHADFLSGARQLAATDGAQLLASGAGRREFPHRPLADGDTVDLGGLTLQAWATPGHTSEHLAYLLRDADEVVGVFTGGSLLVGAAARTDLVAPDRTEELARAQYRSLRRLLTLPDATPVYPTHGAGSFCAAPPGAQRTTTIGRERAGNPLLDAGDEDGFVAALLGGLGSFPPYFLRLAEENRRGPAVLDEHEDVGVPALSVPRVRALLAEGALLVDIRPVEEYAAGHLPGSLAIPLRDALATWLGWLVPNPPVPLVVVRAPGQDPAEVWWAAAKVGLRWLAGELAGGVPAWSAAGLPVRRTRLLPAAGVDPDRVVDVRQEAEYTAGHLPGARHIELGRLTGAGRDLPASGLVLMCGHGERAATAASLLERAGHTDLAVAVGGPQDWAQARQQPLVVTG